MSNDLVAILYVVYGDISGNKEFVVEDVISIGRDSSNSVVIPNTNVSRQHAKVCKKSDNQYELEDLGSHNGTMLNGRLARKEFLQDGDVINIADVKLTFKMADKQSIQDNKKESIDPSQNPLSSNSTEFIDISELDREGMENLRKEKPSITNHWKD